jgi:hypothetical protein
MHRNNRQLSMVGRSLPRRPKITFAPAPKWFDWVRLSRTGRFAIIPGRIRDPELTMESLAYPGGPSLPASRARTETLAAEFTVTCLDWVGPRTEVQ